MKPSCALIGLLGGYQVLYFRNGKTGSFGPIAFVLALLGTIVATAAPAAAAELTFSPTNIAFGSVVIGTTSPPQTVLATNRSSGAIKFERIVASGPFLTMSNTCGGSLAGSQTCHINVACAPTVLGTVTGTLAFFLNKDQKQTVNLGCTGGSATSVNVSGAAIQNGMSGAGITAVSVNPDGSDSATLGAATTDANGAFSMVVGVQSGPVRIRASGGSYVSEQNGATISSPSPLSVLLPSLQSNLAGLSINPLTTFVDSLAQGNISRGENLATALGNSTASIEQDYGISSDPSTLMPLYTSAAVGSDAGRLGLILGALVSEDQLACASAPGGLVTALSGDIYDGVFDGTKSGATISYCSGNLTAIAGTAQFSDAVSGLHGLTLATSGFTFGGTNNALSLNGVTTADAAGDAAMIEDALAATAPPSINSFATTTPTLNTARSFATATLLPNGKVLIAGGEDSAGFLSSTEVYDPVTNTFAASTPAMNTARAFATATLLPNGKVLIAGGDGSTGYLNSAELYDPGSNTFAASMPLMNAARDFAAATLLPNGQVLIAGGFISSGHTETFLNSTELYDPLTNTFAASTPTMNTGRYAATATLLPNAKVLIAGGYSSNPGPLSSTELYDSVSSTFAASTAPMNIGRAYASATLLPNSKVLIAGGINASFNLLSSTELYDPGSNTFAFSTPAMNAARDEVTATLLPNGKVLITGSAGKSTELYDPVANTFAASTPPMNTARGADRATLMPNGKVLIAGSLLSSVELYTP
jgi:hypothetical protein